MQMLKKLFLHNIYQNTKNTAEQKNKVLKITLYLMFFVLLIFKVTYYKNHVEFYEAPDQYAHLSYIDYLKNNPHVIVPQFEDMQLNHSFLQDNGHMNYLAHPPLYYHLMSFISNNSSLNEYINKLKNINISIFLCSTLLLFYIGFSMKVSILAHLGYLSVVTSIPMFTYLGTAISNDNLAILTGLIFAIGVIKLFEDINSERAFFLIVLSFFLAYFTKLTAATMIAIAALIILFYIYKNQLPLKITKFKVITFIVFITPIIYYQGYILVEYSSVMPSLQARSMEEIISSRFYIPLENRIVLEIHEFIERAIRFWYVGWFGILSENSLIKPIWNGSAIIILHFFALFSLYYTCNNGNKEYCLIGKIGYIAFILTILLHFVYSYKWHLLTGWGGALQPRYYLPFLFVFGILTALFINKVKTFGFKIIILLLCFHAIYYDIVNLL